MAGRMQSASRRGGFRGGRMAIGSSRGGELEHELGELGPLSCQQRRAPVLEIAVEEGDAVIVDQAEVLLRREARCGAVGVAAIDPGEMAGIRSTRKNAGGLAWR